MGEVQNPSVAILEDAEQQSQAAGDVGDVGNGEEQYPVAVQRLLDHLQKVGGVAQVLDDVGQDDGADAGRQCAYGLEIGDDDLIEAPAQLAEAVGVVFETNR